MTLDMSLALSYFKGSSVLSAVPLLKVILLLFNRNATHGFTKNILESPLGIDPFLAMSYTESREDRHASWLLHGASLSSATVTPCPNASLFI